MCKGQETAANGILQVYVRDLTIRYSLEPSRSCPTSKGLDGHGVSRSERCRRCPNVNPSPRYAGDCRVKLPPKPARSIACGWYKPNAGSCCLEFGEPVLLRYRVSIRIRGAQERL